MLEAVTSSFRTHNGNDIHFFKIVKALQPEVFPACLHLHIIAANTLTKVQNNNQRKCISTSSSTFFESVKGD